MSISEVFGSAVDAVATHLPAVWVVGAVALGGATLQHLDLGPGLPATEASTRASSPPSLQGWEDIGTNADRTARVAATLSAQSLDAQAATTGSDAHGALTDEAAGDVASSGDRVRDFPMEIGIVEQVIDGDTYDVRLDRTGELQRVRLAWVDAPEQTQPFGKEATDWAVEYVLGNRVVLTVQDIDRYQRTVSQVTVESDGELWDVAATITRLGLAWLDPRYGDDRASLEEDLVRARSEGRGLWSQSDSVPPWDWRGLGQAANHVAVAGP